MSLQTYLGTYIGSPRVLFAYYIFLPLTHPRRSNHQITFLSIRYKSTINLFPSISHPQIIRTTKTKVTPKVTPIKDIIEIIHVSPTTVFWLYTFSRRSDISLSRCCWRDGWIRLEQWRAQINKMSSGGKFIARSLYVHSSEEFVRELGWAQLSTRIEYPTTSPYSRCNK